MAMPVDSAAGEMDRNMAAVNQMAMEVLVNQRVPPPLSSGRRARGSRSTRPNGRKYNSYTPEMRTRIAKYAMMAGDLEAAQHFSRELNHKVAVTSVWRFRKAYTRELKRLHQEGLNGTPMLHGDRRMGVFRKGPRNRGFALDTASYSGGRDEQMEEAVNLDWTPPTDAEMKVIQAKKERSDKISKLMGDYLLKGYRMLATVCSVCGTILLRDKHQHDYCVACSELDSEHAKDDPALSLEAARSQVREHELVRSSSSPASHVDQQQLLQNPAEDAMAAASSSPLTITNVCSGADALRPQHQGGILHPAGGVMPHRVQILPNPAPSPPLHNPQATVLPQAAGPVANASQTPQQQQVPVPPATSQSHTTGGGAGRLTRVSSVVGQSLDSVLDKLSWASEELNRSSSVEASTQLCRLIQACADAVDSLRHAT